MVMRTYDGRPLLPGEVPVIPYYPVTAGRSRRDSHRAASALFEDLAIESAVAAARREDRWQISIPLEEDVTERTETPAAPAPDDARPQAQGAGWGDSGDLIEQWFESGDCLSGAVRAAAESDAPRIVAPEPSVILAWIGGICDRVRRVWTARPVGELG
ncbi:MAG TPA: hypothetical protein VGQ83_36450 [Polyangia bacterium]